MVLNLFFIGLNQQVMRVLRLLDRFTNAKFRLSEKKEKKQPKTTYTFF